MFVSGFMQFSGSPAAGHFEGDVSVGSQSVSIVLSAPVSGISLNLGCSGASATWTSADGLFACGADVPFSQPPAVTGSLVATFSVPYGQAVPISAEISTQGALQAQTNAVAVVSVSVPGNTAFVSQSGSTYPPPAKPAPFPRAASAILACLLLAAAAMRARLDRREYFRRA
jgi:hypothetical protein